MMASPAYTDGYSTGFKWNEDYVPGGPFAYDVVSRQNKKLWHVGFDRGLRDRGLLRAMGGMTAFERMLDKSRRGRMTRVESYAEE